LRDGPNLLVVMYKLHYCWTSHNWYCSNIPSWC